MIYTINQKGDNKIMDNYEIKYLVNGKRGAIIVRASNPNVARDMARGQIMGMPGIGYDAKINITGVKKLR